MADFIKLPIKFINLSTEEYEELEEERERARDLGISVPDVDPDDIETGDMYVQLSTVETFNKDSEGDVVISFISGRSLKVYMPFKEFMEFKEINVVNK